jgi:hypothetical protein
VYPQRLQPDEVITGGDNFTYLLQDAKVQAALNWLKTAKATSSTNADTTQKGH